MKKLMCALLLVLGMPLAEGAIFTVTNTNDSGIGSLRAAITAANLTPNNTINFNIGGAVSFYC